VDIPTTWWKRQGIPRKDDRDREPSTTTSCLESSSRASRFRTTRSAPVSAGHHRAEDFPVIAARIQEQGRATMLDAVVDYPAVAAGRAAHRRRRHRSSGESSDPARLRQRAFAALGLQNHDRPLRGQLALLPGLLRHLEHPATRCTTWPRRAGADLGGAGMHANTRKRFRESGGRYQRGDGYCERSRPAIRFRTTATSASFGLDRFPPCAIQLRVEPRPRPDQEKLGMAIQNWRRKDPTFRVDTDPETGETILSGMGELHLEISGPHDARVRRGRHVGKP